MKTIRWFIVCAAILATPPVLAGGDPTPASSVGNPWTLNLYFENDLFGETDQSYTNGLRAAWVSPDLGSYLDDPALPNWITQINRRLRFLHEQHSGVGQNLVISLGQLIYTPENIADSEVVADDRPYAGFLYGRMAYHTRSRRRLDSLELVVGVVGPASLAHEAQDLIHDLRGFEKFNGWDNQLDNEPGLQLLYEQKRRLFAAPIPTTAWSLLENDFIVHAGLSLGNVATYINLGGEYRIGIHLPGDFGTSAVRPGGDNSAPGHADPRIDRQASRRVGIHAFVSFDGRLVGRDIFLDGNSFSDSHHVDKKHAVADASVGIALLLGSWKLSYAQVLRSREFDGQQHSHEYGSLSLSYTW